ncbi:ETS-related transcription factor Elf-2 isoform X2 [Pleurodeles waltl]|uniref:ETS-related transcription factor Elf-2 isoform X2 n=1 Tax=Pleurodeles waltl TaxID=8319 RepID=UPI0037097CB4
MTSGVVDSGGSAFSSYAAEEVKQEEVQVTEYPAVIVEPVPSARLEEGYAAQILVYDDEMFMMQDVAEEQEIETEVVETVEASVNSSHVHCTDKTIEAAEALLHMESPTILRDVRSPVEVFIPPCVSTPEFIHAAMRPDVITETVVEVSTEDSEPMETSPLPPSPDVQEPLKKKKAGRKPKPQPPDFPNGSPDVALKKKPREGKGNTTYLWEFLLDLLQDKNTCPRYIKWTQREKGIFKLVDSKAVSKLWGKHKNKPDMNYETMGRALSEEVTSPTEDKSLERVSLPPEGILKMAIPARGGRNLSPSSATRMGKPIARLVNIASSGNELSPPSTTTTLTTTVAPRTVRVAMQVPVVMTSLGQKISTLAMQPVNTGSQLITSTSPTTGNAPKVVIQTIPTMMSASADNADKITMQPAKIITIPASQLAHCHQLQAKSGLSASGSINIMGTPLAMRALNPMSLAHATPLMRLSVPSQPATCQTPPRVFSAVFRGSDIKTDAVCVRHEGDVNPLQPLKEESPIDGSKTVTHVVVVSTPSGIALPVTVKTEGTERSDN